MVPFSAQNVQELSTLLQREVQVVAEMDYDGMSDTYNEQYGLYLLFLDDTRYDDIQEKLTKRKVALETARMAQIGMVMDSFMERNLIRQQLINA
jgi:hypothetical protein